VATGNFEADRSQGGTFPKYKSGVGKGKNGPHGKRVELLFIFINICCIAG